MGLDHASRNGSTKSKSGRTAKPLSRPMFANKFPRLLDFLEIPQRSGSLFTTGSLIIYFENGQFRVCLNDRANNRSAFVSFPELALAFAHFEHDLSQDCVAWRDKPKGSPKGQPYRKYQA